MNHRHKQNKANLRHEVEEKRGRGRQVHLQRVSVDDRHAVLDAVLLQPLENSIEPQS